MVCPLRDFCRMVVRRKPGKCPLLACFPLALLLEHVRPSSPCSRGWAVHHTAPARALLCHAHAWRVSRNATDSQCPTAGPFQKPPVPQEGPAGCFLSPSPLHPRQGWEGATGRSRHQRHQSQTPSHAVVTSTGFPKVLSRRLGGLSFFSQTKRHPHSALNI